MTFDICQMSDDNGLPQIEASSAAIHVAMLNTATILDTLAMVLGVYHARLNLAIFFFSISLATESQDQFTFTWVGQ